MTFLSVAAVIYIVGSVAFRSSVDMKENGRGEEEGRRVHMYSCIENDQHTMVIMA